MPNDLLEVVRHLLSQIATVRRKLEPSWNRMEQAMETNSYRPDQQAGLVDTAAMNRARVVAIGASRGLSSLLTLARSGLGHITLIDDQRVGRENVSQTLFGLDDV